MRVLWPAILFAFLFLAALWIHTMVNMPGRSHSGPPPPLTVEEEEILRRLEKHVSILAGEMGERNLWHYEALLATAEYIEKTLEELNFDVVSQVYEVEGKKVRNLGTEIAGSLRSGRIVLVGAHYDSVLGSPGANDNASGVAALLEIARLLAGKAFPDTVRLTAFVNEEPPFFQTERMGSWVYARAARKRGDNITAALSLETVGFYSDEPGSQAYPPPFSLAYPDRGNFIGFVGNLSSGGLVRRCVASFRGGTPFPSEGIAAPSSLPGVGWSDHWAFWQEGFPGVMVTDTAPYRYPHYHEKTDTPDRLDYGSMARVVAGLARVVEDLAGSEDR
jgi:hypothetical protein